MTDPAGLSRTTLIIIVVCAALAGLVVVFVAARLFRSLPRRPAVPLPPVQPLAHRRPTKLDTSYDAPLLHNHSRPPSTVPSYSPKTPDGSYSPRLSLPIPAFPSSSSLQSSDSSQPSPSRESPRSRAGPLPRPLSAASVTSISRRSSRHAVRGIPHAPHSQVQIILPTPLAPALQRPPGRGATHIESDRMSLVDKWVPVGRDDHHSANNTPVPPSTPRASRRVSSTSTTLATPPSSYTYFQFHSPPPPVPQLPPLDHAATPTERRGPGLP
ncbi:hypothetical protein LshimejAT787_0306540 [Lyophyllum shimeji]|uniref:Uncharacterized protein n=1 Tax=Lyophyllum shimeji TaxID=47721 RepID=A0A9P3PIF3_LYOSH|nr:hypothetical protein LshimejAT787_0306540 [Lyophyllum shimeji]